MIKRNVITKGQFETELIPEKHFVLANMKYHNQMKSTVVFWWRVLMHSFNFE